MMVIFILSLLVVGCFGNDHLERFQRGDLRLQDILNSDKNIHRFRPVEFDEKGNPQPVKVDVNIYLRSISHVSEVNMEYQLQFTYRQTWKDSRLAWSNTTDDYHRPYVILDSEQKIWIPDTFFQNEKNAHRHNIDKPNIMIRVHNDGFVLYSVRLTMTLACPMNFEYYPMDVQQCDMRFASYAYTTTDIIYKWKTIYPVQIKPGLMHSLPQFRVTNYSTNECSSATATGTYSCLTLGLELNREFGFFLLHLYIPSMALVAVSWVSFFIDPTSVPGRVTLGVTVLLTFHALSSGVNSILPPVSYVKAIDIWIFGCATFILTSLVEFAVVTYLYTNQLNQLAIKKQLQSPEHQHLIREDKDSERVVDGPIYKIPIVDNIRDAVQKDARIVDRVSRALFPIAFCVFNLFYWLIYTNEQFE